MWRSYCFLVRDPSVLRSVASFLSSPSCSRSPFSALLTSGVTAGQWVAIPGGGGGLGHLAIQYAKAMGARVVAIDLPTKERFCRETCGADEFVDATSASLVEEVVRITEGGPHVS